MQRVADMDVDQVWGQLTFPNFARFAGHRFFLGVDDLDAGLVFLRNLQRLPPRRVVRGRPRPALRRRDPAALRHRPRGRRSRARGGEGRQSHRLLRRTRRCWACSSLHTPHWDPLWAFLSEARLPVCQHIGSSSRLVTTSDDAPPGVLVTLNGVNSMMAAADWLMSDVLERFPGLRVILSEGGAGWIPYLLERAEKAFHDARLFRDPSIGQAGMGQRAPRELFAEHMFVCLVDEQFALRSARRRPGRQPPLGGRFPHGDGCWPENRARLAAALAEVDDADAVKIAETNLRKLLGV
ncbi:amidohydrolase family protein [Yinghuangia aomiensis]